METMEKVIENVKDVAPTEAVQTAVKVATTKPSGVKHRSGRYPWGRNKAVKTGGIIAGAVALIAGVGYVIYNAVTDKDTVEANEPGCVEETDEVDEVDEVDEDNETGED